MNDTTLSLEDASVVRVVALDEAVRIAEKWAAEYPFSRHIAGMIAQDLRALGDESAAPATPPPLDQWVTMPLCPLCKVRPACCGDLCHAPECAPPAPLPEDIASMAHGQGQESAMRDAIGWLYHHKGYRAAALELAAEFKADAPILAADDRAQIHQWAVDAMSATDASDLKALHWSLGKILERTKP